MILPEAELAALVEQRHATPHSVLGMHRAEGGVVVRALLPSAREVVVVPVGVDGSTIPLRRLGDTDVFEGQSVAEAAVFSYELAIDWTSGEQWSTRDPYSFAPTIGEQDLYLFGRGDERRIYEKLGAHSRVVDGVSGTVFAVWAPRAVRVSVMGDFNYWRADSHPMRRLGEVGVWELFVPGVGEGVHYKFEILTKSGELREKSDPFGFYFENAPNNAAIVWNPHKFDWADDEWLAAQTQLDSLRRPMSIYEMHLGSWRRNVRGESLTYRELAEPLVEYVTEMGFTHVEFLPVAEHAYYPSWGYQVTGFYAPTGRYGTPDDFQFLINALHEAGIGVLIDWVPAHFPRDDWALARFDGEPLFEHTDSQRADHPDWGTLVFNHGRNEVRNFLVANALYWRDVFHVDGLRVDAVASMVYLDYSRRKGDWVPNEHGDNRNLEAIEFLKHTNHVLHTEYPGVVTIAEESTDWPRVTSPPATDGLGFSFKWDLGWMHDTLGFLQQQPAAREGCLDGLTFSMMYRANENYVRPLSHDEVVHEKRSLLGRMPGDAEQRLANLCLLLGCQWLLPGKQLLFMGGELGQPSEWDHNAQVPWELLADPAHAGVQRWVADLNKLYKSEPALWEADFDEDGFYWVDCRNEKSVVLSFVRQNANGSRLVLGVINLSAQWHRDYRVGLPREGWWHEVLNSDGVRYGGDDRGNGGGVEAQEVPWQGQSFSAELVIPPFAVQVFQRS